MNGSNPQYGLKCGFKSVPNVNLEKYRRAETFQKFEGINETARQGNWYTEGRLDMKIGYTGSRAGMSKDQLEAVETLLASLADVEEVHHGDCLGGDAEFDLICKDRFKRINKNKRSIKINGFKKRVGTGY